jgi:hypothetical protein
MAILAMLAGLVISSGRPSLFQPARAYDVVLRLSIPVAFVTERCREP